MDVERKRAYNRAYYWRNREKRLAQQKAYWRDYKSKGLRKPRKRQPRYIRDHERYLEKREEILAKQKQYRETHKAEIKERRRRQALSKQYGQESKPKLTPKEIRRSFFLRHHAEICEKERIKRYERRIKQQNSTAGGWGCTNETPGLPTR
jgi:hypothetical protein